MLVFKYACCFIPALCENSLYQERGLLCREGRFSNRFGWTTISLIYRVAKLSNRITTKFNI